MFAGSSRVCPAPVSCDTTTLTERSAPNPKMIRANEARPPSPTAASAEAPSRPTNSVLVTVMTL